MFNAAGKKITINVIFTGKQGNSRWRPTTSNERGRLTQRNDAMAIAIDIIKLFVQRHSNYQQSCNIFILYTAFDL